MPNGRSRRAPGAPTRALLWLAAGLVIGGGLALLAAPEVLGAEPRRVASLAAVPLLAAVPGLVLLLVVAVRSRSRRSSDADRPSAPAPPTRRPT